MGWIGSFISGVGRAIKSVGSSIAKGAANVIKGIARGGVELISRISEWIKNVNDINDAPEYDPRYATVEETEKINDLLEDVIRSYSEEARNYDAVAEVIISGQLESLKDTMKEINEKNQTELIDKYVFDSFDRNLNSIKRELKNIYSRKIENAFSFNNRVLLDILKLSSGETKKNRLRSLAIDTINEANNTLMKSLKDFIEQQHRFIEVRLSDYISSIKSDYLTLKKSTEDNLKALEMDIESKKKLEDKYVDLLENVNLLISLNEYKDN